MIDICNVALSNADKCNTLLQTPSRVLHAQSYLPRAGMIEAAARLREETRSRVTVAVKIEYTRQATRFGCTEVQTSSGDVLWKSSVTGKYTRGRPR